MLVAREKKGLVTEIKINRELEKHEMLNV